MLRPDVAAAPGTPDGVHHRALVGDLADLPPTTRRAFLVTDAFDPNNAEHQRIKKGIEEGAQSRIIISS